MTRYISISVLFVVLFMLCLPSCGNNNNGEWHYEGEVESHNHNKLHLYSKLLNGTLVYQVEVDWLPNKKFLVKHNNSFSSEKVKRWDGSKDRYQHNDTYGFKYIVYIGLDDFAFNMPGENVRGELSQIKARKWNFVRMVELYRIEQQGGYNNLLKEYGNLYWRELDGKFMVIPCGKDPTTYYNEEICQRMYREQDNSRKIIVEAETNFKYYDVHNFLDSSRNYSTCDMFTHKAAEYSLNL